MDIDTECTSSQARLSVTEPSPDDSAETGVESSAAAAEGMNNTSDEGHDTMETVARDNQPETGVESSSSAAEVVTGGQQATMSDDGVTTSAVTSDRPAEMEVSHEDTNSEAEPAEAEHDNLEVGEAAPDEVGVEIDQSDQVVAGDNLVNTDNTDRRFGLRSRSSVGSSSNIQVVIYKVANKTACNFKWQNGKWQASKTASDKEAAPSSASDTGDRGAADSSDEVQQMSAEAAAADDGGHQEAAGDVTGDVGEAAPVEEGEDNQCQPSTSSSSSSPNLSSESSHQPQSDNNSPDQSDTSVQ